MNREERNGADGVPYQSLLERISEFVRDAICNFLIAVMIVYIGAALAMVVASPLALSFSIFEPQSLAVNGSIWIVAFLFGIFVGKDERDIWGHWMCISGIALYCVWATIWSIETGACALGFALVGGVIAWGKRRYLDQIPAN